MISAVFTFAIITAIGEIIFLHFIPRAILRWIIRSKGAGFTVHCIAFAINLWIHFGTMTGSMTAVTAFVVSVLVIWMLKQGQHKLGWYKGA